MRPITVITTAISLFLACASTPRANRDLPPSGIDAVNERIWLAPLVNDTDIEILNEWPRDTAERALLLRHFDEIDERLRVEFRRCEKFGLFSMVEDSGQATIRVTVTLGAFSRKYDSLFIKVTCGVDLRAEDINYEYKFPSSASAPEPMPGVTNFHYAGVLLANYRNSFPYRPIVRLFYWHLR